MDIQEMRSKLIEDMLMIDTSELAKILNIGETRAREIMKEINHLDVRAPKSSRSQNRARMTDVKDWINKNLKVETKEPIQRILREKKTAKRKTIGMPLLDENGHIPMRHY